MFSQIGSAPPAPTQFIGRARDLDSLRVLLTNNIDKHDHPGVVRLIGARVKEKRASITTKGGTALTQALLAERSGLSVEVIKKAERGEPVLLTTAARIAMSLGTTLNDLTAPAGESLALQALVAVRGLPGVGKTTLAAQLAHDPDMRRTFEGCLWVSLGQSPDALSEIKAWGRALGIDLDQERDKKYARARIGALLSERRLLIIIDDAWTVEPAFDLMVGGPRCVTLVTTRVTEVADAIAPTENAVYSLKVLSVEDAVKLLEELASTVVIQHRDKARELAQELECLPLALQVAGRLLRAEERKGLGVAQLLDDLQDPATLLDKNVPGGPKIAALLKKSTDVLEYEAQQCFTFLAPFGEKPATFDQKALDHMWGRIVKDPAAMKDLLISRGLLEPVGSGRFWLHAILVAHARSLLASPSSMP